MLAPPNEKKESLGCVWRGKVRIQLEFCLCDVAILSRFCKVAFRLTRVVFFLNRKFVLTDLCRSVMVDARRLQNLAVEFDVGLPSPRLDTRENVAEATESICPEWP